MNGLITEVLLVVFFIWNGLKKNCKQSVMALHFSVIIDSYGMHSGVNLIYCMFGIILPLDAVCTSSLVIIILFKNKQTSRGKNRDQSKK